MNARNNMGAGNIRGGQIASYAAGALARAIPAHVVEAAKLALTDAVGAAVGAHDDAPVRPVRRVVDAWGARGNAQVIFGPRTTPALAALVNGTMAHAMDYDDSHQMGAGHISCVCGTAALAVAGHLGSTEQDALAAFVAGYEVMARLAGGGPPGVGRSLHRRGFHPTSVFGRVGAAVVAGVLMRLDEQRIARAIGIAATTAGGLVASFGTHSKPFHAGKAAMDGILSAELAANDFESATHLFETERGLLDAFIQDRRVEVPPLDFADRWELLRNGFKPYASCRATHAAIQTARKLAPRVAGRTINRVHATVHPNVVVVANNPRPQAPLEFKFAVRNLIAMGLTGYRVVASDFDEKLPRDATVAGIAAVTELTVVQDQPQYEAHIDVYVDGDATPLHADTDVVLGHADNPMPEEDFRAKFDGLVAPVLGDARSAELYGLLRNFDRSENMNKINELLSFKP